MPTTTIKKLVFAGAGLLAVAVVMIAMRQFRGSPGQIPSAPSPVADVQAIQAKAETGDAAAQNALGDLCAKGAGIPQNFSAAFKWYRSAAEKGLAEAQYNLAVLYETGQGANRDEVEAAKWHRKAADQGHAGAAYNLAAMYSMGRGVGPDAGEAAKWYRQAAEEGDPLAQYNLARRYEVGKGVSIDLVEAYKWHKLASRQGIEDAAEALERIKAQMTREEVSEGKRRAEAFVARKSAPAPPR